MSPPHPPSVTVSIVSHRQSHLVANLLGDLSRQTLAHALKVIVTHNVPDAERAYVQDLEVEIRHNDAPLGFGANHNAALAGAQSPWVLVLNPDIRLPDPTMLERLVDRHRETRVGVVAPVIRNPAGDHEDSVRHNLDPISLLGRHALRRDKIIDPTTEDRRFRWVAGMFMAIPLSVWTAVGGFDDRFFLYCEDYDLCARVAEAGLRIEVDRELEAIHDARRSSHRSFTYLRWHLTSLMRVWVSRPFWRIWRSDLRVARRKSPRTGGTKSVVGD